MMTWKERIMEVMTGGENGRRLWFKAGVIKLRLIERYGIRKDFVPSEHLRQLVKSGHIERAMCPEHLKTTIYGKPTPNKEYLYRVTGKPFKRGGILINEKTGKQQKKAAEAHEIWRVYRMYPKWFRDMMMIN